MVDLDLKQEIVNALKDLNTLSPPNEAWLPCDYEGPLKVEIAHMTENVQEIMKDENIKILDKIQTLLDIAKDPHHGYYYKYMKKTVNTAKKYLMGIVRFLKQYEDTENVWKWLDSQFDDYYITTDEKYFGINLYGDSF